MAESVEPASPAWFEIETLALLRLRLRRPPSRASVPGSLPVLFFGDLPQARIATVGLNPSRQEYLDTAGRELTGALRRFETLASVGADRRQDMTDEQADQAIRTMRAYFQPGRPVYSWFAHLDRVLQGFEAPYQTGASTHLDLVQEATDPTWSPLNSLDPPQATALLKADLPFLQWELETFPLEMVLCNGRTVFDQVSSLLQGRVVRSGRVARLTWWIARARVGARSIGIAGWNLPLVRPTGLGASGENELGETLARECHGLGINF